MARSKNVPEDCLSSDKSVLVHSTPKDSGTVRYNQIRSFYTRSQFHRAVTKPFKTSLAKVLDYDSAE